MKELQTGDRVRFIEEVGPNKGYSFIIDESAEGVVKEIWPYNEKLGCCGLTVEVYDIHGSRRNAVVPAKYVERIGRRKKMDFLKKVRKCFPSACWEKPTVLPVYIARHGKISGRKAKYAEDYPFVGCAKRFEIEKGTQKDIWNEQLVPWPYFVALIAKPDDGFLITDAENDPRRTKFFWLIYADEEGAIPFQVPSEREKEVIQAFKKLREEKILIQAPKFIISKWDDVSDEMWKEILNYKDIVSSTPSF